MCEAVDLPDFCEPGAGDSGQISAFSGAGRQEMRGALVSVLAEHAVLSFVSPQPGSTRAVCRV